MGVLHVVVALGVLAVSGRDGEGGGERVSFYRDVRPILQARCQGCHQPARRNGDLALTSHADVMAGALGEPVVVPGAPEESALIEAITPNDGARPDMPKDLEPLSAGEVDVIRRWIAEGAVDDTPRSATLRYSVDRPPVYESPVVLTSLDYSPDGSLLAVSGYHEVLLYRADGSELVGRLIGLSERIEKAVFSPDGSLLAVAGGTSARMGELQIWSVAKRTLELSLPLAFDTLYGASWSPDGRLVAIGLSDNTLRAIDAKTGRQVLYQGAYDDWVLDTAFSTDGSHLVSVSRDRSMKLIQVATEQFIDNITSITPGALKGGLMSVARHPQKDELLVGGADGVPRIYRMHRTQARKIGDDYNLIRAFAAMPGRVFSVAWSPDGGRVLAGSSHAGTGQVRLYEAEAGNLVWTHEAQGPIYAVAFSPDGKVVSAGGFAGVVELVEASSGAVLGRFVPMPSPESKALGASAQ